ncbi:MAG TPA: DNA polymerase III subunit epsilon [Gammaproteobacteria bacterium]|nr:DNA polymerase III subunit epsilon [Gammaproteobacteria bacterium]
MRQIVLDTETTGLEPAAGHRVIEIGGVELVSRRITERRFHHYLQPDREIDPGAMEVHGITNDFLADKPRFKDVVHEFLDYIKGAELIIHNAPFDIGFLNHEMKMAGVEPGRIEDYCSVTDTLALARQLHPGQRNNLDALCKRYGIDNTQRTLHGALLDAEILADVYLAMTGGQATLTLEHSRHPGQGGEVVRRLPADRRPLRVVVPTEAELAAHDRYLDFLDRACAGGSVWRRSVSPPQPS